MISWGLSNGSKIWFILEGFYHAYLIKSTGKNILIDTGRKTNFNQLNKKIFRLINEKEQLDYLILTHTHFDHCENAARIKADFGCKVIVSKLESGFLKNGSTPLPAGTNAFTNILSKMGNRFVPEKFYYKPVVDAIEIQGENKSTDLPKDIHIVATPGHSIGSISIIVNNEIAIVGDTMFGRSNKSIFPPFADDKNEMFKSWKMLLDQTNCYTFLPGHGKPISRDRVDEELMRRELNNSHLLHK